MADIPLSSQIVFPENSSLRKIKPLSGKKAAFENVLLFSENFISVKADFRKKATHFHKVFFRKSDFSERNFLVLSEGCFIFPYTPFSGFSQFMVKGAYFLLI